MNIYVALFRGINVGRSTRIAMRTLIAMFEQRGCASVRSYVQSGNIVFGADAREVGRIMNEIEQQIAVDSDVRTWITIRNRDEMRAIVDGNPFMELNAEPTSIAVAFHRGDTSVPEFRYLGAVSSSPDRVERRDRETWLYLPNGFSGSALPNAFFTKDLKDATTRNWRTVTKLVAIMDEID